MKVAVYSAKSYDRQFLDEANTSAGHDLDYFEERLNAHTAPLAAGKDAVCLFVNDLADAQVVDQLADLGVRLLALRSAGFNHVDLNRAAERGLAVVRVPAYSPYAVAEHALALLMSLNRRIHRAYNRAREGNFSLEGLLGRDIHGSTAGLIGTGKIGLIFARILAGLGCRLIAHDPHPNPEFEAIGGRYVDLDTLLRESDIVSLHSPLTPETHHLIDDDAVDRMKPGVILINTSRGGLVDTKAVIHGLKTHRIGALGLDVYEQEENLFFENLSETIIQDDVFQRLLTFPNVLITGHQAFFTADAMRSIAGTTIANIKAFERGQPLENEVRPATKHGPDAKA